MQSNASVSRGVRLSLTMKHNNEPARYVSYSVFAITKSAENEKLRRNYNVLMAKKLH